MSESRPAARRPDIGNGGGTLNDGAAAAFRAAVQSRVSGGRQPLASDVRRPSQTLRAAASAAAHSGNSGSGNSGAAAFGAAAGAAGAARRAPALAEPIETAEGEVPWEYRDEPLSGASRWMSEERVARDTHAEAIIARLCATGLHREIAEDIALGVPKEHRRNGSLATLERAIAEHLAPFAADVEPYAPVELFVGPPGAGKTTTIAKIAAQERARRGARLSLLAADGFRVGAVEQLRIYADIIGTPFAVARTPQEIEQSLLATRGPVLVDTAGRSSRDPRAQEMVSMLAGIPGVRTHLVVAAATTVRDVNRLLDAYGRRRPNRVVLTRVDEADSVSHLMQVFKERGLKVSFLGIGQRVPEDLERATPQRLAAHVLGHGLPQGLPA
jgi:flagellar biosynthesis protein FlhF